MWRCSPAFEPARAVADAVVALREAGVPAAVGRVAGGREPAEPGADAARLAGERALVFDPTGCL